MLRKRISGSLCKKMLKYRTPHLFLKLMLLKTKDVKKQHQKYLENRYSEFMWFFVCIDPCRISCI